MGEIVELRKECPAVAMLSSWAANGQFQGQLHAARRMSGLQAYADEEPMALTQAESAYNIILTVLVRYACARLDLSFVDEASLSNRRMRQAVVKRQRQSFKGYFKSDLFWDD